jgi:hypothetical protein
MLFVPLVPMDRFYKTNNETDLARLYYVAFIEPMTIFPTETLSFDSKQFTNNSMNKVIEAETTDHFLLLEEHFTVTVLLYQKNMKFNSRPCHTKL